MWDTKRQATEDQDKLTKGLTGTDNSLVATRGSGAEGGGDRRGDRASNIQGQKENSLGVMNTMKKIITVSKRFKLVCRNRIWRKKKI